MQFSEGFFSSYIQLFFRYLTGASKEALARF